MKTTVKGVVLTAAIAAITIPAKAQMTLTGEIRPRTEFRHGYQAPLDSGQYRSIFTSQRSRLNFGYAGDKYKVGVSVQDVRTWGSQSQLNTTDGLTSFHEGWGQYWFTPKFSLKAGRQEIAYNDERIFGSVSWTQQGRSHDAGVFMFEDTTAKFTAHAGIAYNQNAEANINAAYTVAKSYKEMQYIWLNKAFNGGFSASVLFLNNGLQPSTAPMVARFSQTAGAHLEYKKGKLFASARFYNQMGKDSANVSGNPKEIQAYMAGADLAYTLKEKFTIGVGMEMLSGQSQTDTTTAYKKVIHQFNPFYGTGHKFNGFMDYYYAASAHGNVGLNDIYFKTKYKAEKWWAGLDVHMFSAAADVYDAIESVKQAKIVAMDKNLGTEIDLTFVYNFSKQVALQFGYSHYMATETIASLKGITDYKGEGYTDETANWAYLMFTFKPNFMK